MITQTFPSTRPKPQPPVVYSTGNGYHKAQEISLSRNISLAEFWKRDNIVKAQMSGCLLQEGKKYMPNKKEDQEKYGNVIVKQVFRSYFDFPISEPWPSDNTPYTITVQPEKMVGAILCTPDWLSATPL